MASNSRKAFVFSIDAFVAFTLSLVAIYSLIFFSAIPSAHYALLTQAHYLAKDSLTTLSLSECIDETFCKGADKASVLGYIIFRLDGLPDAQFSAAKQYLDRMMPSQFGYALEMSDGGDWTEIYSTASDSDPDNNHAKAPKKISVSAYSVVFSTDVKVPEADDNPFGYVTCDGDSIHGCKPFEQQPSAPSAKIKVAKITVFA